MDGSAHEILSVVVSFLALITIPVTVVLAIAVIGKMVFRRSWPATRKLVTDFVTTAAITVGITLVISFVFKWTGFFTSQYYRPSRRDYGQYQELGLTAEDVIFQSNDGTRLHGWFLPARDEARGTVIYFHGSGRNISFWVKDSAWLCDHSRSSFSI